MARRPPNVTHITHAYMPCCSRHILCKNKLGVSNLILTQWRDITIYKDPYVSVALPLAGQWVDWKQEILDQSYWPGSRLTKLDLNFQTDLLILSPTVTSTPGWRKPTGTGTMQLLWIRKVDDFQKSQNQSKTCLIKSKSQNVDLIYKNPLVDEKS